MRIGLHLIPNDWTSFRERAAYADQAGFSHIWVAESHLTVYDVYSALQVAAGCTSRALLGPGCTNAAIRHESVVAAALATIDTLAGGRVVCGLGSGDTPVVMLGKKPARLAELRAAVQAIQTLTAGTPVRYGEHEVRINWIRRQLPVYLIAEGPRTLELGGEVADGILAGNGVAPEVIAWVEERVAAGVARSGRAATDVDLWHACMLAIADTPEEARAVMRTRVGNRARHNFMAAPDLVPPENREEVRRLIEQFDVARWTDPKNAPLVTDYMLDRFAVTGTVDQVIDQLRRLEALGVQSLMVDLPLDRFDTVLHLLGDKVLPALARG